MTDDLVERLRNLAAVDGCQASREAADRIEAQDLEIERLKEEVDDLMRELAYRVSYSE